MTCSKTVYINTLEGLYEPWNMLVILEGGIQNSWHDPFTLKEVRVERNYVRQPTWMGISVSFWLR
jgi:hypothetical protein